LKTDDDFNYLAKFVKQLFSKTHLDAPESAKNIHVEDFDKKDRKRTCQKIVVFQN
jgi:hypothetical protein